MVSIYEHIRFPSDFRIEFDIHHMISIGNLDSGEHLQIWASSFRCAMPIPKWTRVWDCDEATEVTDLEAVVQGRSGRCSTREFMDEMNERQPGSASRPWDLPDLGYPLVN